MTPVSAVFRSFPQLPKQTAEIRRSCFPPLGGNYCGCLRKGLRGFRSSAVQKEFKMQRRGWVEVSRDLAGFWDVFDWSEHHDSGQLIGSYFTEAEARDAATKWAADNNRKCFVEVCK
jgi:hypothetical protein